jgi:hypothetical protein
MTFPSITKESFDILKQVEQLSLRPDSKKIKKKKEVEQRKQWYRFSPDSHSYNPQPQELEKILVDGKKFPLIEKSLTKKRPHNERVKHDAAFRKDFEALLSKYSYKTPCKGSEKISAIRRELMQFINTAKR